MLRETFQSDQESIEGDIQKVVERVLKQQEWSFENLENSTATVMFSLSWFNGNLSTETV